MCKYSAKQCSYFGEFSWGKIFWWGKNWGKLSNILEASSSLLFNGVLPASSFNLQETQKTQFKMYLHYKQLFGKILMMIKYNGNGDDYIGK